MARDPVKQQEAKRRWYLKNKDRALRIAQESKTRIREKVRELKNKPCADCGISYPPYVMDFDHKSDKFMGIARMVSLYGYKRILEETEKCDLVCANCHRERTFQRIKHNSNQAVSGFET